MKKFSEIIKNLGSSGKIIMSKFNQQDSPVVKIPESVIQEILHGGPPPEQEGGIPGLVFNQELAPAIGADFKVEVVVDSEHPQVGKGIYYADPQHKFVLYLHEGETVVQLNNVGIHNYINNGINVFSVRDIAAVSSDVTQTRTCKFYTHSNDIEGEIEMSAGHEFETAFSQPSCSNPIFTANAGPNCACMSPQEQGVCPEYVAEGWVTHRSVVSPEGVRVTLDTTRRGIGFKTYRINEEGASETKELSTASYGTDASLKANTYLDTLVNEHDYEEEPVSTPNDAQVRYYDYAFETV